MQIQSNLDKEHTALLSDILQNNDMLKPQDVLGMLLQKTQPDFDQEEDPPEFEVPFKEEKMVWWIFGKYGFPSKYKKQDKREIKRKVFRDAQTLKKGTFTDSDRRRWTKYFDSWWFSDLLSGERRVIPSIERYSQEIPSSDPVKELLNEMS